MVSERTRAWRWVATATSVAVVATAVPLVALDPPQALAAPGAISAVSVTSIFFGRGISPEVSGDGRFIAFADLNGGGVRVGEAAIAGATQIALNGQGVVANNAFNTPAGLSANGRHVVVVGEAQNLTPTDATRQYRVYTIDRDADADGIYDEPGFTTLRRVPGRVAAGAPGGGFAIADISSTGRYVAFTQPDVDGANSCLRAYRYDRDTDTDGIFDEPGATATIDVSVSTAGTPGARTGGCGRGIMDQQRSLSISGDGQHVAFLSDFDNLVASDTNGSPDVFVRDLVTNTTIRVPASAGGSPFFTGNNLGEISSTGRFILVITAGSPQEVLRYDRDADADGTFDEPAAVSTVVVRPESTGGSLPSLSGDGGTVAMWTSDGVQVGGRRQGW